jgi:hypothetical protein
MLRMSCADGAPGCGCDISSIRDPEMPVTMRACKRGAGEALDCNMAFVSNIRP